jgi:hypothetical protein
MKSHDLLLILPQGEILIFPYFRILILLDDLITVFYISDDYGFNRCLIHGVYTLNENIKVAIIPTKDREEFI